jgi:hypothetical protein
VKLEDLTEEQLEAILAIWKFVPELELDDVILATEDAGWTLKSNLINISQSLISGAFPQDIGLHRGGEE